MLTVVRHSRGDDIGHNRSDSQPRAGLASLPETTPSQVRTLLQRCLEKDPRRRLGDISDARIELDAFAASGFTASDRARDEESARARKAPNED